MYLTNTIITTQSLVNLITLKIFRERTDWWEYSPNIYWALFFCYKSTLGGHCCAEAYRRLKLVEECRSDFIFNFHHGIFIMINDYPIIDRNSSVKVSINFLVHLRQSLNMKIDRSIRSIYFLYGCTSRMSFLNIYYN